MKLFLTDEAIKQFRRLPKKEAEKIRKKLIFLEKQEIHGKNLSGKLAGRKSLKAWPYRIVYVVLEKKEEIWVTTIAHRQEVYK